MLYTNGGPKALPQQPEAARPMTKQAARPPAWRRPRQAIVDEKIERMLETYKMMDEVAALRN